MKQINITIWLLFGFICFMNAQPGIDTELLTKNWVVNKVTVNGKIDEQIFPSKDYVLFIEKDETFSIDDENGNEVLSGTWDLTPENVLKLIDMQSGDEQWFKITTLKKKTMLMEMQGPPDKIKLCLRIKN